jgi:hypothetical protein
MPEKSRANHEKPLILRQIPAYPGFKPSGKNGKACGIFETTRAWE